MSRITHRRSGMNRRGSIGEVSIALDLSCDEDSNSADDYSNTNDGGESIHSIDYDDEQYYTSDCTEETFSDEKTADAGSSASITDTDNSDFVQENNEQAISDGPQETDELLQMDYTAAVKEPAPTMDEYSKKEEDTAQAEKPSIAANGHHIEPLKEMVVQIKETSFPSKERIRTSLKILEENRSQSNCGAPCSTVFEEKDSSVYSAQHTVSRPALHGASSSCQQKPKSPSIASAISATKNWACKSSHVSLNHAFTVGNANTGDYGYIKKYVFASQEPSKSLANGIFTSKMHNRLNATINSGGMGHGRPIRDDIYIAQRNIHTIANGIFTSRKIINHAIKGMLPVQKPSQGRCLLTTKVAVKFSAPTANTTSTKSLVKGHHSVGDKPSSRRNSRQRSPENIIDTWLSFTNECTKTAETTNATTSIQSQAFKPIVHSPQDDQPENVIGSRSSSLKNKCLDESNDEPKVSVDSANHTVKVHAINSHTFSKTSDHDNQIKTEPAFKVTDETVVLNKADASWGLPLDDEAAMLQRWNNFMEFSSQQNQKPITTTSSEGPKVNNHDRNMQDTKNIRVSESTESSTHSSASRNTLNSSSAIEHQQVDMMTPKVATTNINDRKDGVIIDENLKTTAATVQNKDEQVDTCLTESKHNDDINNENQAHISTGRNFGGTWYSAAASLEITNEPWWETPQSQEASVTPAPPSETSNTKQDRNELPMVAPEDKYSHTSDSKTAKVEQEPRGDSTLSSKVIVKKAEDNEGQLTTPSESVEAEHILVNDRNAAILDTANVRTALEINKTRETTRIANVSDSPTTETTFTTATEMLPNSHINTESLAPNYLLEVSAAPSSADPSEPTDMIVYVTAPNYIPARNHNGLHIPYPLSSSVNARALQEYDSDDYSDEDSDVEIILEADENGWAHERVLGMEPSSYRRPTNSNTVPTTASNRTSSRSSRSNTPTAAAQNQSNLRMNRRHNQQSNTYYYPPHPSHAPTPASAAPQLLPYPTSPQIPTNPTQVSSAAPYTTISYEHNGMVYYNYHPVNYRNNQYNY